MYNLVIINYLSLAHKVLNLKIEIFLYVINIRASNTYMIHFTILRQATSVRYKTIHSYPHGNTHLSWTDAPQDVLNRNIPSIFCALRGNRSFYYYDKFLLGTETVSLHFALRLPRLGKSYDSYDISAFILFLERSVTVQSFVSFEKSDDSLTVDCYIGVRLAKSIFFNSSTEARACGEYWEKYYSIGT